MTTKNLQMFSGREEFLSILNRVVEDLELVIILCRNGKDPAVTRLGGTMRRPEIDALGVSRLYLAAKGFDEASIDPANLEPGRLGLLQIDLPREEEGVLMMGQLAVKTHWLDRLTGQRLENRRLLALFNRAASEFKKQLMTPVLAENIATGGRSVYRDIWYAPSAKDFAARGGQLMQEGVRNVRFWPLGEHSA